MKRANKTANVTYETDASLARSQEHFAQAINKYGNQAQYLLAGQPDDVKAMNKLLTDKGIDSKNVQSSTFRGLK